jgi:hypothetical protein
MQYTDNPFVVHRTLKIDSNDTSKTCQATPEPLEKKPLVWNWEIEHEDRRKEANADAAIHDAAPFQVDRRLLKDIVREKMGEEVVRIKFLGAGEHRPAPFHLSSHLIDVVSARFKAPFTR